MLLHSTIDPTSSEFTRNAEAMRALVAELRDKLNQVAEGGGEASRARHTARGKMLARDRVDLLVDPGTAFLELSPLAANGLYGGDVHSASIVTGVGRISGRECVIVANDATIKGGTYYPITVKKHLRAQDVARQNNLPCVYMVDSGGAFLPLQDEIFPDERHFGRIFYNQAQMSAAGIPQVAIVMGSCTAGGAYVPAMSDESIIVRNQGTIFLGGPPLVKAATGEVVTAEELGGADVHSRQSGVTDHYAQNDAHAIGIARRIVATLKPPAPAVLNMREPREPLYAADEIYGVVSADGRRPFDVRDIIARIVDGSEFDEFKIARLSSDQRGAWERTGAVLSDLGHEMVERDPAYGMAGIEFTQMWLRGIYEESRTVPDRARLERSTRQLVAAGRRIVPGRRREQLLRARAARTASVLELWNEVDVLLMPVLASTAIAAEGAYGRSAPIAIDRSSRFIPFNPLFNVTGQPSIAVPAGFGADGLPLSVQLVGRPGAEDLLYSLAGQLETARPWAQHRPPDC